MAATEKLPPRSTTPAAQAASLSPFVWGLVALAIIGIVVALSFLVPGVPAPAH